MEKEEVLSLIQNYGLSPVGLHTDDPKIAVNRPGPTSGRPAMMAAVKAAKPEILEYFLAKEAEDKAKQQAAAADKKARIAKYCPGLKDLEDCLQEWEEWHEAEQAAFESPEVITLPAQPKVKYHELAAKYPAAAAYLKAESYSQASNFHKSSAGTTAMKEILDGQDYKQVLRKMENWLPATAFWD